MSKVFKQGNQYTKNFTEKFGEANTLIVSADIENQINELKYVREKKLYGYDWFERKPGLSMFNSKKAIKF